MSEQNTQSQSGIKFNNMALYHIGSMMIELGRLTKDKLSQLWIVWSKCDEADSWRDQIEGRTPSENSFAISCRIYATVLDEVENKAVEAGLFKRGDWPFDSDDDGFTNKVRLEILAQLGVDIRPSHHGEE